MAMRAFAKAWPGSDFVQQGVGQLRRGYNQVLSTKRAFSFWLVPTGLVERASRGGAPEHAGGSYQLDEAIKVAPAGRVGSASAGAA